MSTTPVYEASRTNGRRATKAEMAERYEALAALAAEHGPCSVRHLFYRSVVAGVPGITKNENGYLKVQRAALKLRRDGTIPYRLITDSTRWMRKPTTYGSLEDALAATAARYRRDLWAESEWRVEVWAESDSTASTIYDITSRWDVPLMVARGYSSETFAYNAAEAWREADAYPVVLYLGDHDPAGLEIEGALRDRLSEFSAMEPVWRRLGVTWEQVEDLDLPGTTPKKNYEFPLAVEAEALPPHLVRDIVNDAIEDYVDHHELAVLKAAERSEREILRRLVDREVAR